jgi:DNA-binding transcriptional ArsR family regulator
VAVQRKALRDPSQVARARKQLTPPSAQAAFERIQKVMCDPARLKIIQALTAGPLCVDDLAAVIERAPAATSQHLRVLRRVNLIEGTRSSTTVYYQLRPGPAEAHLTAVLQALEPKEHAAS